MPKLKKQSYNQRKLKAKKAQKKYRRKNLLLDRERNRKRIALRRKDEEYRFQERIKNMEYRRKKRLHEKYTEQRRLKAEEAKRLTPYYILDDNDVPVEYESNLDEEEQTDLSFALLNTYGYNESRDFIEIEKYDADDDDGQALIKFNPNAVKRGRGRPRKDSLASNISNPHNSSFLEEDLQCSTDDDEDGFQEVSEDENNPSSYLDQSERLQSGVNEDGSELIDAAHIKTEMKIEPSQIGEDDSMDLDPNYDPSDFLTMHNRMGGNNDNNQQQQHQQDSKMSQFLQQDEAQHDNMPPINDNKSNMHQMPLMMGPNDNMGIDDDLAISESDEEDDGNVRVKREIFNDQMDDEQLQQQQQQSMMDMQMQQQQQQEQLNMQNYVDMENQQQQQQHHQSQNQTSHDDNNDDDWLRF